MLTERQYKLYNLLMDMFNEEMDGMTVAFICQCLPNDYDIHITDGNYTNCPALYNDINEINKSGMERYILIKNGKIYNASKEQVKDHYVSEVRKLRKQAEKVRAIESKFNLHLTVDLLTGKEIVVFKGE